MLAALWPTSSARAELRAGAAEVRITPPAGMPVGGGFRMRMSAGVDDELYAKALVLERGGVRAAIVSCDLLGVSRRVTDAARRRIGELTRVPPTHVMISATHTHAGPEIVDIVLEEARGETAGLVKAYHDALPEKIAESVRLAESRLRPARAAWAVGHERSLAFNRRFLMKDGSVRFNPGKLNPDIVRSVGPTDPEVPVVYFDAPNGEPLALFTNFAMHVAVTGRRFSADYPGALSRRLAEVKGPGMLTLFTSGAAGNTNHFDVGSAAPQSGQSEVSRVGTILAAEVLRTLGRLRHTEISRLRVRSETVKLPLRELAPGEVERARRLLDRVRKDGEEGVPFLDTVAAFRAIGIEGYGAAGHIDAEVQVIALGDEIAWVGLPGEVFVELGMATKQASPFPLTIVTELANDDLGNTYVPNLKAYAEGGYEVVNSLLAPGGGEKLVEAATRMLIDLHRR